jgi:hypothetical protein
LIGVAVFFNPNEPCAIISNRNSRWGSNFIDRGHSESEYLIDVKVYGIGKYMI